MITSKDYKKAEAAARVTALRWNHGSYAAAARATRGRLSAGSLSAWHRQLRSPQACSMHYLRDYS